MVAAVKFQAATEHLAEGRINFASDTFKILLTNTAPDAATDVVYADVAAELANANGYVTGGFTVAIASSSQSGGVYSAVINDAINALQAVGGSIGPFRYPVLYDATTNALLQYWDLTVSITLLANDYLALDFLDPYVLRLT